MLEACSVAGQDLARDGASMRGDARGPARHLAGGLRRRPVVRRRDGARHRLERDHAGLPPPALVRRPADGPGQPGPPAQPALGALPARTDAADAIPGHALVVCAMPFGDDPSEESGDHFTRAMRLARAGELARTAFARDETIARLGTHRVAILARRDDRLGRRVRVLRTLLDGVESRGDPTARSGAGLDRGTALAPTGVAAMLLDELARTLSDHPLGWGHVRPLCLVTTARGPHRGVRGRREPHRRAPGGRLQRRADQGGLRRRRAPPVAGGGRSAGAAAASAAGPDVGPGALVGQGPLHRQPDDQRADGDGRREAGLPQGVRHPPRPAPADGYFEWYPTSQTNARGKPVKQPFFIRPRDGGVLAMAGLYEIWRDPTKGRGRRRPLPLDLHGPHDRGGGLPRPHPRPDAADGRAGALARVARPDDAGRHLAAGAGRARPARGLRRPDPRQQRAQQRARARRAAGGDRIEEENR